MKRLLAFALAAVMLLSVTACKANREPDVIEGGLNKRSLITTYSIVF